jgi:hypothetical protein
MLTIQDPELAMDKPMVIAVDRPLHALFASSNGMAYKYCVWFAVLRVNGGCSRLVI